MVGRGSKVLRCAAIPSVGDDAAGDAYLASSRPANGDAADVGPRRPQQLRADCGYWWVDAKSCANDLCVCEYRISSKRRRARWRQGKVAGPGRESDDGETKQLIFNPRI